MIASNTKARRPAIGHVGSRLCCVVLSSLVSRCSFVSVAERRDVDLNTTSGGTLSASASMATPLGVRVA